MTADWVPVWALVVFLVVLIVAGHFQMHGGNRFSNRPNADAYVTSDDTTAETLTVDSVGDSNDFKETVTGNRRQIPKRKDNASWH